MTANSNLSSGSNSEVVNSFSLVRPAQGTSVAHTVDKSYTATKAGRHVVAFYCGNGSGDTFAATLEIFVNGSSIEKKSFSNLFNYSYIYCNVNIGDTIRVLYKVSATTSRLVGAGFIIK